MTIIREHSLKESTPLMKQLNLKSRVDKLAVVRRIIEAEEKFSVKFPVLLPTK